LGKEESLMLNASISLDNISPIRIPSRHMFFL